MGIAKYEIFGTEGTWRVLHEEAGQGSSGEENDGEAATKIRLIRGESRMDMKEGSAMTEASGLVNEHDGIGQTSDARWPPQSPSQDAALRWAERLREVTVKAPLQSLFIAFLLGIWVTRRR
jgi:hypothetical protein